MKSVYKYVSGLALAGLLSAALVEPAAAQRGFHGGGHVSVGIGGGFRAGGIGFSGGFRTGGFGYAYGNRWGYPRIGFGLGILPYGYYPFYWGPDLYYYYGGVFYRPADGGGYTVTTPPVGAEVPQLPKGAQAIAINGEQFYEFQGVYYRAITNDKNQVVYEVAGKDGVLNTDGVEPGQYQNNGQSPDVNNQQEQMPQVGDLTDQLPEGSRKVTLNGHKYYVSPDDIYYEDYTDRNGNRAYRVASTPNDGSDAPQQNQN